jgi:hypothetical protein
VPEVAIPVVKLAPNDPEGDEILDRLERWPSFWSPGPEDIDGLSGRRIHVGNVETEDAARGAIEDSLGDITPDWRRHLRVT